MRAFSCWRKRTRTTGASLPNDCGPGMPWNGNSLFALYNANRFAAAYIRRDELFPGEVLYFSACGRVLRFGDTRHVQATRI